MPFEPQDPAFEARIRASFARQAYMAMIGATMTEAAPGEVTLVVPIRPELTQQHGFLHGGVIGAMIDTACGFAASSLMAPDVGVLTVEYKVNFVASGVGDTLRATARVRKAGRTVTFVEGEAHAVSAGASKLVATMQATMMTVRDRPDVRQ